MQRYKMQVRKTGFNNQGQLHVCADPAGEWVKRSDVARLVDTVIHATDPECTCDDLGYDDPREHGITCAACSMQEAIDDFQKGNSNDTENEENSESSFVREGEAGACET